MYQSRFLLITALMTSLSCGMLSGNSAHAQAADSDETRKEAERLSLFESLDQTTTHPSESKSKSAAQTAREIRQARALYRANQRVARFEYNLWMGHEPLRPQWNAVPMMSSRYGNRKVFVPVYIYPR